MRAHRCAMSMDPFMTPRGTERGEAARRMACGVEQRDLDERQALSRHLLAKLDEARQGGQFGQGLTDNACHVILNTLDPCPQCVDDTGTCRRRRERRRR